MNHRQAYYPKKFKFQTLAAYILLEWVSPVTYKDVCCDFRNNFKLNEKNIKQLW